MTILTPSLCRASRALLGWTQPDLAKAASVGINTIRNFELGKVTPMINNLRAIQGALEAAGIVLIPENGGGEGVRLRRSGGAN